MTQPAPGCRDACRDLQGVDTRLVPQLQAGSVRAELVEFRRVGRSFSTISIAKTHKRPVTSKTRYLTVIANPPIHNGRFGDSTLG